MKGIGGTIFRTLIFMVFCCSLTSLSPRSEISPDILLRQSAQYRGDFLPLKQCVEDGDMIGIRQFKKDFPCEFYAFYKDILNYALFLNNFLMIRFLLRDDGYHHLNISKDLSFIHQLIEKGYPELFVEIYPSLDLTEEEYVSCICLALKKGIYGIFFKWYASLDLTKEECVLKFALAIAHQGHPFIVGKFFFPYLSEHYRKNVLKKSLENCCFEQFKTEFSILIQLRKIKSDILMEMYKIQPQIMEWINFASHDWKVDDKIDFVKFVAESDPGCALTLHAYEDTHKNYWRWEIPFLRRLLKLSIPIKSLSCLEEGNALSSLINQRCLGAQTFHCYDDLILKLIKKDRGAHDDTPIGKPLNHYLYMLSNRIGKLRKKDKKKSLVIVKAFLKTYRKVDSSAGQPLNPAITEQLHGGAKKNAIEEYMQTALGSTLALHHPSRELYSLVKHVVDLKERNEHRRNFVHHLALLNDCFERDLKKLFLRRGYRQDDIKREINLQDDDGMTPLMYATRNSEFFKQLLKCGANIHLTDKRGFSVWHHLMIRGDDASIRVFLKWNNIPFVLGDSRKELKKKLGVRMKDSVTLGVTFFEQLEALCDAHIESLGSKTAGFSTHFGFQLFGPFFSKSELFLNLYSGFQREEDNDDHRARIDLSMGMDARILGGPSFVTKTYALLNPFHVCEAYGRYAPDFSFALRAHSVLLDGFKRVFLKTLKRSEENGEWTIEDFRQQLRSHKDVLFMSQDYLVPLLIQCSCEGETMTPFLKEVYQFFMEETSNLKTHTQEILMHMDVERGLKEIGLASLVSMIEKDEEGLYFPFCYMLPPHYALLLKDSLLEKMGTFPPQRSDFKNGVYRNFQALMRSVMRWKVGSYLKKLKAHETKVLKKKEKMEKNSKFFLSFQDVWAELSSSQDRSLSEKDLKERLRVNGRSVSFIVGDEEYILKVRKKGEDMRDHAEIACGLEWKEDDILDNYGAVCYGHLGADIKKIVHTLILDKSKNPRISLKAEDLTRDVVLFRVRHTHYFEYLSDPKIPFDDFKTGIRRTMEQAFTHIKERGRFMETFSDIAHDRQRPGIFLPMVYFLDYVNGLFLGTFLHLIDSYKTVDACLRGMRDLGNTLTSMFKDNMIFGLTYGSYLKNLYEQVKKDGEDAEYEEMMLVNRMQEALAHTVMTASHLLLIRLLDHPEELRKMTSDQFIADLEEVLIEPFFRILGSKGGLEKNRPFYRDMLATDFEDFKVYPHHFEYASSLFRHGDLARNNYYQSFYRLTYLLMSSMCSFDLESDEEMVGIVGNVQDRHVENGGVRRYGFTCVEMGSLVLNAA